MPALAEVHLVSDPDYFCHPLRSQMISLPIIWQAVANPSKLRRFAPRSGYASKCGTIRSRSSLTDRASYLKVRSLRDSRIQPHSKKACRSPSNARSLSFKESENDGRASSPTRSFGRMANEMQKHPSPSARPVTNQGSNRTAAP
jgi:hypothetical protein